MNHREKKSNLQLIGVTAMFLASKIEDIYAPDISDLVYITDDSCSSTMIRSYERKMSAQLEFNFGDPLCIHFLRRNSKALKVDSLLFNYVIEKRAWPFCVYGNQNNFINLYSIYSSISPKLFFLEVQ